MLLISFAYPANAQGNSSDGIWFDTPQTQQATQGELSINPQKYRAVTLNVEKLQQLLQATPLEGSAEARLAQVIFSLPLPDGTYSRFQIVEAPIMASELAAKFPEIKTYAGQGIDDRTATVRFDWTPTGFHAIILSVNNTVYIDPFSRNDTTHYMSYYKRDFQPPAGKTFTETALLDTFTLESQKEIAALITSNPQIATGTQLRTYRLAVAADGEYTTFQGGTVPLALAAIVTTVNRVDGIYEREIAVRLVLIANENLIIYTDPVTDPYTDSDASLLLSQNQANLDAVIGSANYDVGHVFTTGGGGLAGLGVVCDNSRKARGETGSSSPVGDPYDVDYVAHELGHQFGGNHTFNGDTGSCNGNANASTAYEPGSGSTIMAYAGICSPQNLQPHSNDYFHGASLDEITAFTTLGGGNSCALVASTGNNPPTVNAGVGGFTIPAQTPFSLTGSATDPNGDALTYNWEEFDLGSTGAPGNPLNPPFFRSWSPSSSPTRIFPRLSDLLNNTTAIGEVLPNVTGALNFRLTARDNLGGVNSNSITFNVTTAAGPFQVTAPNTTVSWTGNTVQNISWDVANTMSAPVSCADVMIDLSTDGGLTYSPVVTTANDGSESITVPNGIDTTNARIRVGCATNIFFDISDVNFTIIRGLPATEYPISGNAGVGGATLSYTDGTPKTATADGSGFYSFMVPSGWSGTVTPSKSGYIFSPASRTYTNVLANQTNQNYHAKSADTTGVFRPSNGLLYLKNQNTTGFADVSINYGLGGDYPVTGDWDGNGTATIGVYRNGSFYLRNSNTLGFADMVFAFGQVGDQPVAGDWNGDGTDTIGIYRPSTGQFLLRDSNSAGVADYSFYLGNVGDVGIAGDWTAKGFDTVGVFRPSNGIIFLKNTNQTGFADIALNYGLAGDQPVVGDWDGNGTDTIGVYRNAQFLLRNSNTIGFADIVFGLGNPGDMPIAGDWDGLP